MPTAEGDFEISSFGLRSLTDPAFHAHIRAKEAESARLVVKRIRELRERRALSVETVAERAGLAASSLSRIEQGDHDGFLPELQRVVEAMGHGFKDLIVAEADEPSVEAPDTAEPTPSPVPVTP